MLVIVIIIVVSMSVAYALYVANRKKTGFNFVSKARKTQRQKKNAEPTNKKTRKIFVRAPNRRSVDSQRKLPTSSTSEPSAYHTAATTATAAKAATSSQTTTEDPVPGSKVGVGVGTSTYAKSVSNAEVQTDLLQSETAHPAQPAQPVVDVKQLPKLESLIEFTGDTGDLILKDPAGFEKGLQTAMKGYEDHDGLIPFFQQITGRLLSISVNIGNVVDFSSKLPPLNGIPDERINKARQQFNTSEHLKDINSSISNLKDNKSLQNYKSVLNSVLKYVEDYINVLIEPEMTVRSIVNIYTPPDHGENNSIISIDEHNNISLANKYYGPFKQVVRSGNVVDNDEQKYDVSFDSGQIQSGRQMIYVGYGYSGSGKTHTLLNTTDGILKRLLEEAKYEVKDLTFEFVEIYGEAGSEGEIREEITYYSSAAQGNVQQNENSTLEQFSNLQGLNTFIKELSDYRADWTNYEKGKPRIRHTPNNPKSSRAHLIINARRHQRDKILFSILDMGGSEDVDAIEKLYYTEGERNSTKQFTEHFTRAMEKITGVVESTFKSQPMKLGYVFKKEELSFIPKLEIQGENELNEFLKAPYEEKVENIKDIEEQPWKELFDSHQNLEDEFNTLFTEDIETFQVLTKFNVLEKLFGMILTYRNANNKTLKTIQLLNFVINKLNEVGSYELPLIYFQYKKQATNESEETSHKNIDDMMILAATSKSFQNELMIAKSKYTFDMTYAQYYKKYYKLMSRKPDIDIIMQIIERVSGVEPNDKTKTYVEFVKYLDESFKGKNILDKYEAFKNQIIETYHKPLREQGNYINASIVRFRHLSADIKNGSLSSNRDTIMDSLCKALRLDNESIKKSKLVILTCMKIDHGIETISRSLEFAHCVNPLKSEQEGYHQCVETSQSGHGYKDSVTCLLENLQGRNFSEFLDEDTVLLLVLLYDIDIYILTENIFKTEEKEEKVHTIWKVPCFATGNKQFILIKLSNKHFESLTYQQKKIFTYSDDDNGLQDILKALNYCSTHHLQTPAENILKMLDKPVKTLADGTCLLHSYLYLTEHYKEYEAQKDEKRTAARFRRELYEKLSKDAQLQVNFDAWKSQHLVLQSGGGSPQFALSRRGIERLQRFGLFTLVKAVRFKYYEQNLSKLKPDIILLTDRMASLTLTIVLLVLSEDTVATGVIFDQVLSSALLSVRSQDEKMLLLPFYLPFV